MKKIFILLIIFISFNVSAAMAQTAEEKMTKEKETHSAMTVKYDLAYPGLLPDNPLYKLKILRDKITASFINDPNKKVDFYLLQADKGILAAAMLIDKNKFELAQQTLLKAENNLTLITQQFGRFTQKPGSQFFQKLRTASKKHQEVIGKLIARIPRENRKTFEDVLWFSKRNLMSIDEFEKKAQQLYP